MLLVFGVALLVVAAGVVVLFAMVGELASRIPDPAANRPVPIVEPYEDTDLGRVPQTWPAELPDPETCVLLVLSTMCNSCSDVADQLGPYGDWAELGVVLATGGPRRAADFVAEHGLAAFRHFVDEGGEWVGTQLGTRHSPLGVVFRDGRMVAAYRFNNVDALRRKVMADLRPAETAR